MRTDLTVFAKDYPESRLMVEVRPEMSTPAEQDLAVKQLIREMWGANCHHGLIITPERTYVLRDTFMSSSPEAIRLSGTLATPTLFARLSWPGSQPITIPHLELLTQEWLRRLTTSYEAALPDDPKVMEALFPDLVGAVAEGRVVAEVVSE
jgi:hypothetical protein